jgi:DNA-directed RNA polymerase subunit beta'
MANPDFGRATIFGDAGKKLIVITVGRILFNEIWPSELGFYNNPVDKKKIIEMIFRCYQTCGHEQTIVLLDRIKEIGFREATRAGISIGIDDLIIPREILDKEIPMGKSKQTDIETKRDKRLVAIAKEESETADAETKHRKRLIAEDECLKEIKGVWDHCNHEVSEKMMAQLEANQGRSEFNPVWIMIQSGARGNKEQVRQLIGLRGLMAKPDGGYVKRPVLSNFRDGLDVADFFISCHGVRKGESDRSKRTPDAGYLTRKLVSAAQDVVIGEEDCGTQQGIWVQAISDDGEAAEQENTDPIVSLIDRITGRVACEAVLDPHENGKILVPAGQIISGDLAKAVHTVGVKRVKIRSPLACESKHGLCMNCYGQSMTSVKRVQLGDAVGVIAAQSIGEPGTQLTMRTFHTGGTVSRGDITGGLRRATQLFEASRPENAAIITRIDGTVSCITEEHSARCVVIKNAKTGNDEKYHVPAKKNLCVKNGDLVSKGQPLSKEPVNPHEILDLCGLQEFQEYMIREVQKIYGPQVSINCKHIEVILRQMLAKVCVTEPGDTTFVRDDQVGKQEFAAENKRVSDSGHQPALAKPSLLGITQAALRAESFLSAASFQNTTKILAEAAVLSKQDDLLGFKEKVMTGGLIPAGTGFKSHTPATGQGCQVA